jgi:uncharacterized ferritin-like protein (DUF455 family)
VDAAVIGSAPCPAGELRGTAATLLALDDPCAKARAVLQSIDLQRQPCDPAVSLEPLSVGRSTLPRLVSPRALRPRPVATTEGRAALIHALAHIELNAINLGLDVVARFGGLPNAFYTDWITVARDEARHFLMLEDHLHTLGHRYGDLPAHNGLWEMAERTRDDLLARLALVPRTLEARGLDASPLIRDKLARAGDMRGAALLDVILADEIGHVATGNRWFRWLCARAGRDPLVAYEEMARTYRAPQPRGPFNLPARRAAGFTEEELAALARTAG